jgi:glutathione peroxidase
MADPGRRTALALIGGALVVTPGRANETLAWDFRFPGLDGGTVDLGSFRGRVLLVTNTASFCGYTYQYEALETLYQARADEGLTVIGVPSGDFNQESKDNTAIRTFCESRFGVSFPMAGLSHVRGAEAAPFYAWVKKTNGWEPHWNFNKVLIGRDGRVAGTYGAGEEPDGTTLSEAISVALGKATAAG